jgi:uroporphyrinogen-III synthase
LIVNTVELRPRTESDLFREFRTILSEGSIDWLVFMSPEGVQVLFELLRTHGGLLPSMLGNPRIVAVGPKTKQALIREGVREVLVPSIYNSNGVAELLTSSSSLDGIRVVLARSSGANDTLSTTLAAKGANVATVVTYSSVLPKDGVTVRKLVEKLKEDSVDGILFTSSLSASNLFAIAKSIVSSSELSTLLDDCLVGAIGPATADRLRQLGIEPDLQPDHYLIEEALGLMAETLHRQAAPAPTVTASFARN